MNNQNFDKFLITMRVFNWAVVIIKILSFAALIACSVLYFSDSADVRTKLIVFTITLVLGISFCAAKAIRNKMFNDFKERVGSL